MLSKPYLAKCSDRQAMPKSHPTSGSPEEWYRNELLLENGLLGISFDFFVNWSSDPIALTPVIWIKGILNAENSYEEVLHNTSEILVNEFGSEYLQRLLAFAALHNLSVQFIIFRDDYDWNNEASTLLKIDATLDAQSNLQLNSQLIAINDFKALIQQYSGGAIAIGAKGLIYGTSQLECFLSKTDSLYPGDADLVLLNSDNLPVAIVEFKKHTLSSSIDKQKLSNYYPHPDSRKYDRLAVLRDYLSGNKPKIPIVVIYYPTGEDFKEGSMELVSGVVGKLSSLAVSKFPLPENKSKEQEVAIIKKNIKAIEYYKSIQ